MEREKGRERITTSCEYERESCPKVVKKWLSKYHFSIENQVNGLMAMLAVTRPQPQTRSNDLVSLLLYWELQ